MTPRPRGAGERRSYHGSLAYGGVLLTGTPETVVPPFGTSANERFVFRKTPPENDSSQSVSYLTVPPGLNYRASF
jgi:hypothetical protein